MLTCGLPTILPRNEWATTPGCADETVREWRIKQLAKYLEKHPLALLDIPCSEIPHYISLAQHKVPNGVESRLQRLASGGILPAHIQHLEDAHGAVVNLDFFGVRVPKSALPGGMTPSEYWERVRHNFADYFDPNVSRFEFYPGLSGEAQRWKNNPLETIFSIQLVGRVDWLKDATVVVSGYSSKGWTFSTAYSGEDAAHPVSGNRHFGYRDNGDGTVTFYTRGVDRISTFAIGATNWLSKFREAYQPDGVVFTTADRLWKSFQKHLKADLGSQATILKPITHRPDASQFEKVMDGEAPRTSLGCTQ